VVVVVRVVWFACAISLISHSCREAICDVQYVVL
jgi:hypothetical protein